MKQEKLFDVEKLESPKPWYVSYVLGEQRMSSWGVDKAVREASLENYGTALFFYKKAASPRELFARIQEIPFVAGLFRNKYWVTFFGDAAFVDDAPLATTLHANTARVAKPTHFGLKNGAHTFFWSIDELKRQCCQLEQFSNCEGCRGARHLGGCTGVNVVRWARKNDVFHGWVRFNVNKSDDMYYTGNMDSILRRQSRSPGLKFVSPGTIAGPFQCKLMFFNEVDPKSIEHGLSKVKERRVEAQNTSIAVARCEAECYLYGYCGLSQKPYYGQPYRCQTGKSYWCNVPGPFTEYEIAEAMKREIASRNPRPRQEVAYIAALAGSVTSIFGYDLTLRKMDPTLRNVEFIHARSGKEYTYSYEDAMEIITAKYYSSYGYTGFSLRPHDVKPMSDEAYLLYAELCQADEMRVSAGWGHSYQPITYISWDARYSEYFDIGVRCNYGTRIRDIRDAAKTFQGWSSMPKLATDGQLRAVRAEADRETNPDKPL